MSADHSIRAVDHPTTILNHVYNDWDSLDPLLGMIDQALFDQGLFAGVLVIDDGSTVEAPTRWNNGLGYRALPRIDLLTLKRNLGHQRAIAVGIAYAEHRGVCDELIVMDGDGEDNPRDIPRLIACSRADGGRSIVFAERAKRSESLVFRLFYLLYQTLHWMLTGRVARVGNFSLIPRSRLSSLSVVSELWIHYAAAAFRSRQPLSFVPTARAKRLRGKSQMNFPGLVTHGLSALAVNGDLVGVRVLLFGSILGVLNGVAFGTTSYLGIGSLFGVPVSSIFVALGFLWTILMAMTAVFVILVLGGRSVSGFLPKRDHGFYCEGVWPLTASSVYSVVETSPRARRARRTLEIHHDSNRGS